MSPWILLAFFWSGVVATLGAVAMGGILVYITKREAYEVKQLTSTPVDEVPINLDEFAPQVDDEPVDAVPDIFAIQNAKFMSQLAEDAK